MSAAVAHWLAGGTVVCLVFLAAVVAGLAVDRQPRRPRANPFHWRDE